MNGSESRSVTDDLVEYGRELVVVPRLCEHCLAHTAVVLWIGTWPDTYYCRCCYEEMAVELNAALERQQRKALERQLGPGR